MRTEAAPSPVAFSTRALGGAEGRVRWSGVIEQAYCELDVLLPDNRTRFDAELLARPFGDLNVGKIRADPHTVMRTPAMIASDADDDYLLCVVTEGHAKVHQSGRTAQLHAGSLVVADCAVPFAQRSATVFEQVTVRIPRELLTNRLPGRCLETLTARAVSARSGAAGLVAGLLCEIATLDTAGSPRAEASLSSSTLDMIVTALVEEQAHGMNPRHAQDFARAVQLIERRLHDTEFSLSDAAAELGLSSRYMQKLFHLQGTTGRAWVARARVERARQHLLTTDMTVEAIGRRVGLLDVAHFSKLFHRHVGVSPGLYRRHARRSAAQHEVPDQIDPR